MKLFLVGLFLFFNAANAQTYIAKANSGTDETANIQTAFNNQSTKTVLVSTSDIVINGTLNIPHGKTMKIEQ